MVKHKPYTPEYKLAAVLDLTVSPDGFGSLKLAQTEGVSKTATNLGINSNMLAHWKREHASKKPLHFNRLEHFQQLCPQRQQRFLEVAAIKARSRLAVA